MKRNYISLTAKTALGAVVMATGVMAYAQSTYIPVQEYELTPTETLGQSRAAQAPADRVNPAGRGATATSATGLPKFEYKPQSIMRSAEAPRGNVYAVVNRFNTMETGDEAYLGELNLSTGRLVPKFRNRAFNKIGDDYSMRSVAYRKGEVIVPEFGIENMNGFTGVRWTILDLNSGLQTAQYTFTDPMADPYSFTYDPDKDLFYLVSFNNTNGTHSMFGIVDPNAEGGWKYIAGQKLADSSGMNQPFIAAICYNPADKQIYAFDNKYGVYNVEYEMHPSGSLIEDNVLIEVGETSVEELDNPCIFDCDPDYGIVTGPITYSPMDEMFVAVYRDNMIKGNRIIYIHPETFEGFVGKTFDPQDHFVNDLFCIDEAADPNAPELAATPTVTFEKESLTGKIDFTTPKMSFIGVDLTGSVLECVATIDGNVADKREVKAGESYSVNLTLAQGQHRLEYTTSVNGLTSPARTVLFYVGYDAPIAPKNVEIAGNVVSWKANGNEGYHQGYVDMADMAYNIYLDGEKQNEAPVKATSYTLNVPDKMKRYDIGVAAISQGQESPATVITPIFGKGFSLPFSQVPTREEAECFDFYNENHDAAIFKYGVNNGVNPGLSFQCGYFNDADDWVILPKVNVPDPEALYEVAFTLRGHSAEYSNEAYEVYVATQPEPANMKKGSLIYKSLEEKANGLVAAQKHYNFAVPAAGEYYVGIHVTSTRDQSSLGVFLSDFSIRAVDGANSAVPGNPTDVKITPGEFGEPSATATVVLPTKDLLDRPLPADEDIELTFAYADDEGKQQGTSVKGKPGETVTVTQVAPKDGFVVYYLTPSNKNGVGYTSSYSVYVGIDTPLCPENIVGVPTEDNLGLHLTWDAPGEVGAHGGYVDFDAPDFTYTIYTISGITLHKIADTKDFEYTFYPFGELNKSSLTTFNVGPVASNIVGKSYGSVFIRDDLGTPYELPMKEEFNTARFTYSPYTFFTSGAYNASTWENSNMPAAYGVGEECQPIEGTSVSYATGPALSKMNLPKFTTTGIKKSIFMMRYWDYASAPKSIQIYGRSNKSNDEFFVGEVQLKNPKKGVWTDAEITLPEQLNDCSWIQLRIATTLSGKNEECLVLDSYTIMPDADSDLKVSEFDGRIQATLGDNVSYNVVVANSGRERMGGKLHVDLVSPEGAVLATRATEIENLNSSQTSEFTADFTIDGSFAAYKNITVRAVVDADDEILNNNVKELSLAIMPSALPIVSDLKANVNADGNVELDWSEATTEYGNFENFEAYKPFEVTESLDYWQNLNGDDLWPSFFQNQTTGTLVRWENDNKKQAWQVYDWNEMYNTSADGTTYTTPAHIDRLKPHSGNQALIARCGGYEEGSEPVVTSKWLVSPQVKPNTTMSFYYTTFASNTTEYIEIWTCEKESGKFNPDDPNIAYGRAGDFKKKASKSKSGEEVWELVTYTMGRKECYFALRYISYDGYAAAIDDLSFTPANMLTRKADSYSVYRTDKNGLNPVLIADKISDTNFVDKEWNGEGAFYYVVTHSTVDNASRQSAPSNIVSAGATAVGEINVDGVVSAGRGVINVDNYAGERIVIAAADGKVMASGRVDSDHHSYAVDKGIYLVTLGKKTYKVVVK